MADVDIFHAPKRCADNQPPLADAIRRIRVVAPITAQPHLKRLADELEFRTPHCPDAVTTTAVRNSLGTVLGSMIDAVPFRQRHEAAFDFFGLTD
ncbi:MAG: hypothetical protein ACK4SL_00130 [Candidatus Paceibacteria bacterium]